VLGLGAAVRQALGLGLDAIDGAPARWLPGSATKLGELPGSATKLGELPGETTHDLGQTRCAIVTAKIDGLPAEQAAREPRYYNTDPGKPLSPGKVSARR
jgi:hypothetical protein